MSHEFNMFDKIVLTIVSALFIIYAFLLLWRALRHFDAVIIFLALIIIPLAIWLFTTLIKIFAHKYNIIQINQGDLTIISDRLKEKINVPFDEIKECIVRTGFLLNKMMLGQVIIRTTRGKEYKIVISKPDAFYVPMASHINISLQESLFFTVK